MLQINPFLDCTVYSGIVVHIGRNSQLGAVCVGVGEFFASPGKWVKCHLS